MSKKIAYKIKTVEDLEKIYYGHNKDGKNVAANEIKEYEDYKRTEIISKLREKEIQKHFTPIGDVKRISRCQNKTNDFRIENKKILIEVTSINTVVIGDQDEFGNIPINLPSNENEFIERINRCIEHAEKKEDDIGYYKIAVIYYDIAILGLRKALVKKLFDPEFIRKTRFSYNSVDTLIFLPPKASGIDIPKTICFVKEYRMMGILDKIKVLEIKILEDKDNAKA